MLRLSASVLSGLLGLALLAAPTSAQCPIPDQLDGGPCCAQAQPKIPFFPNFKQDSLEICWRDCNVDQVLNYRASWTNITVGPSTGIPCGERMMNLQLHTIPGGVLHFTGVMRLQYSRTWMEIDPSGLPIQVWRFLVNGDLRSAGTVVPAPCPMPPCMPAFNGRARFTGYVDFASNCALVPTIWQHAWMLTHACDAIDHNPAFPRAGAFHPDRSYTFVGPGAGFLPGPIQPIEGTPGSVFEDLRRRNLPPLGTTLPATCDFEERLQFRLLPNAQFCFCGLPVTPQFMVANLDINGSCGSTLMTPGGPHLPGFVSMGIGTWTLAGIYPGVEALRWNAGNYDDSDPCTGAINNEVFFGVTTINGFPAFQLTSGGPAAPLPLTFIDQSNSLRPPNGGTVMNIPYVSDLILNLNH